MTNQDPDYYWSIPTTDLFRQMQEEKGQQPQQLQEVGLTNTEANRRLSKYGKNLVDSKKKSDSLSLLFSQFKSPIIVIFIFTSVLSFFLGQTEDAIIIISIVVVSGLLGFWQEKGATDAVAKLLEIVQLKTTVLRDSKTQEIPSEDVVPGDIVTLKSGDSIPADCVVIESRDLFVNEATLTGESYPAEKSLNILPRDTPLRERTNSVFMGTFVVSGMAKVLVIKTGANTELGKISDRLRRKSPETEFERGVRRFGYFLMEITLMLVISILVINVYFGRPIIESFLFSLALAIGLTPQLLPAIISVNLSHGAKRMANEKVIVKRLASIENLGSMNILCSDKTGTLTIGEVKLQSAIDVKGNPNNKVLQYAYLNSVYETGFSNPIDKAIKDFCSQQFDISVYSKLDEIPYDFIRKRLTCLISSSSSFSDKTKPTFMLTKTTATTNHFMVTKGAVHNILEVCSHAEMAEGKIVHISIVKQEIQDRFKELSSKGFRILGVCYRNIVYYHDGRDVSTSHYSITKADEINMTFLGFLIFFDPIKPDVIESISKLNRLGISLKIITGDNTHVAEHVGQQIGLLSTRILTGPDLHQLSNEALMKQADEIDIFAEIEPNQKERIILALRHSQKNVVGYMGDGINDASALHAADASISVDKAADVVKEAADFVLLEKDLAVLAKGVEEGRRTFANTLKYVFMATSANFGNMFSMAGVSLFLPFLPLLPKQILLMNLMTDAPEMTISTDNVDLEILDRPRRWDIRFIKKFMIVFGLLSTMFDFTTFGVLLFILHSSTDQFRTAWFMESVISASIIVLVIRTRKPLFGSKPGKHLLLATLFIVGISIILPFTPVALLFGFTGLSILYLTAVGVIVSIYIATAEIVKKVFYKIVTF
ncbi:MAG TPA: magnesium-translocating P-type ATPase [Candidatus Nitrosopolaris sp.]|nr:magnesium-translocating P-type ATPase [Candidatus Nitrosopolaris sp.]